MEPKVIPLLYTSYLAAITNSLESHQFQNLFAVVNEQEQDVLRNGELSCAYFVSCILHQFLLIDRPHATVAGCTKAMEQAGWTAIEKPKVGCVLVWEPQYSYGEEHAHIGFFIGKNEAISNSAAHRVPKRHDWIFSDTKARKITSMHWHPRLEQD